jgi:Mn-containing catalase
MAPERPEEFAPGLDPELQALADAMTEFKDNLLNPKKKSVPSKGKKGI